jgi:putative FmdB family regulatory protein
MPIFRYRCNKCSREFDFLSGMTRIEPELKCPSCNSKEVEKLLSGFRIRGRGGEGSSPGCSTCSGGDCSSCR